MADFDRVYEIAPVFRAENSFTHRHMCEFIGLDLEMAIKEHYDELLDFMGEMFNFIFDGLEHRFHRELKAINEQFEFEPFKSLKPALKLTFEEGIQLLKENGIEWSVHDDLSTKVEKQLGDLGNLAI
jgi:aspartyl/asparaginyl-tRNA synthetase